MRSVESLMGTPGDVVEDEVKSAVTPNKDMFPTLPKSAVKTTLGDPLVNGFRAQAEKGRQLGGRENDGKRLARRASERLADYSGFEFAVPGAHGTIPIHQRSS